MEISDANGNKLILKTIKIDVKCSDNFGSEIFNDKNILINKYNGYVPKIIPGRYGDFVELEIDIDTGKILNWNNNKELFEDFIASQELGD